MHARNGRREDSCGLSMRTVAVTRRACGGREEAQAAKVTAE